MTALPRGQIARPVGREPLNKLALVYVLFDEVVGNYPLEPVGHKRVVSRILDNLGYRTVFLPEGVLSREKTSGDLARQIKELMLLAINPP